MISLVFDESAFHLEEKRLCLDFANTMDWHASDHPQEMLPTYADLAGWGKEVGLVPEPALQEMLAEAARRPEPAREALRQAIELREAIYQLFLSHLSGKPAPAEDIGVLNRALAKHAPQQRILPIQDGFAWEWSGSARALDWILGPVAQSAANLLTSSDLSRVGMCADENGCGWLFYDTSRNHSRRWCDMQGCGNRAKARVHYARKKTGGKVE
jgi:predicted RNA-binding Zn ribbon-like protein